MKRSMWVAAMATAAVVGGGCGPEEGGKGYDDEDLSRYKTALPARSTLALRNPPTSTAAAFGGTPTIYPEFAVPVAMQINGLVGGTLDIIELIAAQEPTLYDSDDLEFWWGPIPDSESALADDHFSLFIHDRIEDADYDPQTDLRYEFAIIRGLGNDVANLTPILYGVASPVEGTEDHGIGAFIYDFDNNVAFENEHNPGHGPLTSGRMATIFLKGPDEDNPAAEVTAVVAAFRDFLPEDAIVGEPAINVDYFWGNFTDGVADFDFIDLEFLADVINDTTAVENMDMKLAFYNNGIGRAEVGVTNGDLGTDDILAVECWDAAVSQTYLSYTVDTGGGPVLAGESGAAASCVWDATQFGEVPDLSDVPGMQTLVDDLATFGIPEDLPADNG